MPPCQLPGSCSLPLVQVDPIPTQHCIDASLPAPHWLESAVQREAAKSMLRAADMLRLALEPLGIEVTIMRQVGSAAGTAPAGLCDAGMNSQKSANPHWPGGVSSLFRPATPRPRRRRTPSASSSPRPMATLP